MHHLGQKLYTSSTDTHLAPSPTIYQWQSCAQFPAFSSSICSGLCCDESEESDNRVVESLCFAEWFDPNGRCSGDRCVCSFTQIAWNEREYITWTSPESICGSQDRPGDIRINSLSYFMFSVDRPCLKDPSLDDDLGWKRTMMLKS